MLWERGVADAMFRPDTHVPRPRLGTTDARSPFVRQYYVMLGRIRGFLRSLAPQLGDFGALDRQFVGEFGATRLDLSRRLPRELDLLAQPFVVALETAYPVRRFMQLGLQAFAIGAGLAQRPPQADVMGLLLLQRP